MGITNEQYERIIRFMDARMESVEMDAFERELEANPEMRHHLDFEQSLRNDFSLRSITNIPNTIPESGGMVAQAAHNKITGIQKWLAISAAVISAVVLFAIFWQKPANAPAVVNVKHNDSTQKIDAAQKKDNQPLALATEPAKDSIETVDIAQLFKKYFKKDVLPEHYPLYLAEALMDYESGNYKTLQQLNLNNLPSTRSANETYIEKDLLQLGHYYKALAFLQTNHTREAISNFNWVLNNQPDKALRAKAQWYLALTYLKESQKEKAAELCRTIVNNKQNDALVKSAEKILGTLGN